MDQIIKCQMYLIYYSLIIIFAEFCQKLLHIKQNFLDIINVDLK